MRKVTALVPALYIFNVTGQSESFGQVLSQASPRYARVREGTDQQIKVDKRTFPSAPFQNLWVPKTG